MYVHYSICLHGVQRNKLLSFLFLCCLLVLWELELILYYETNNNAKCYVMKLNSKYASIAVLYPQNPRDFAWQPSVQLSQNLLSSLLHSHDCSYYVSRRILAPPPLWNIAWIQKHITIIVFMHIEFTSFSFERQIYTPVCPCRTNLFRQLTVIYFILCARMNLFPYARCSIRTVEPAYNHIGLCNASSLASDILLC